MIDWSVVGDFIGSAAVLLIKSTLAIIGLYTIAIVIGHGLSIGWKSGQKP